MLLHPGRLLQQAMLVMYTFSRYGCLSDKRFWLLLCCVLVVTSVEAQLSIATGPSLATEPSFARELAPLERQQVEKHVYADGQGLPVGSGTAVQGQKLYAGLCASCHGSRGQGGSALELVGDRALLNSEFPDRGIAVYWPYAPTLYEYVRRSMPPDKPYSLNADEYYSLVAFLLQINGLLTDVEISVDKEFLSRLEMPNKNGFKTSDR